MARPDQQNGINYIEFTAPDLDAIKRFYGPVFGWEFTDWGADYISFSAATAALDGGFERGPGGAKAPLVVLFTADLEASLADVQAAGAEITVPIFTFPGGSRFQFRDPAGNELSVWSKEGV